MHHSYTLVKPKTYEQNSTKTVQEAYLNPNNKPRWIALHLRSDFHPITALDLQKLSRYDGDNMGLWEWVFSLRA